MSKPRKQSRGFSNKPDKQVSRKQPDPSPTDYTDKERQALVLINEGKLQEAEAVYRKLISADTCNHIPYGNLAAICLMQGKHSKSIPLLQKALHIQPNYPEAHNNLGLALKEQGDLTAAIASYRRALKLKPDDPNTHNNLGHALQENGDLTAAIASYNTALKLNPNDTDAHNNLGHALQENGDLTAAIASYNTALNINPNHTEALNNLGNALKEQGDINSAITSYNKALKLNPNYTEAHYNLGISLHDQGDLNGAITSYNAALKLNPNYTEAHWNLSLTMLLGGDYKNGWEKYEWRTKRKSDRTRPHASPKCNKWGGEFSFKKNNKLILIAEQGLGDTLQFMRYAQVLKQYGADISVCAQTKLHSLIQTSGIDPSPLSPQEANQISEGHWIPLLSIPRHLGVSPDNPIVTEPYIKTKESLITKWENILRTKEGPIIGINWQGNPKTERLTLRGRSLALQKFAPITTCDHLSLLSLQKGFGSEQLDACSFRDRFVSCQDQINEIWDFLETAAIIANCDLIITSDTSVAHLAGGMGKNTWLLLQKLPDWRWGLEENSTFWYPSMRLFRQKEHGNWDEVMERVTNELHEYFGDKSTHAQPAAAPASKTKNRQTQDILAPISLGELVDKITILQIKTENLQGNALENVKKELMALERTLNNLPLIVDPELIQRLTYVNKNLWQIEDDIRHHEREKTFAESFIKLARSVYLRNDERSAIKKEINTIYGSQFIEEKSYEQY